MGSQLVNHHSKGPIYKKKSHFIMGISTSSWVLNSYKWDYTYVQPEFIVFESHSEPMRATTVVIKQAYYGFE